jgi:glycosyltransferase involved in cell wall biosynthesis
MSSLPTVSVILPTRNRAEMLPATLMGVRSQTVTDLEIVVVDDGSIDGTPAYLASEASRDSRIRLLRNAEARGAAASRNEALAHSRGRFVAFLDDDTLWAPDRLEKLVRALEVEGPGTGMAYSPYESVEIGGKRFVLGAGPYGDTYRGPWQVGTFAVVLRREVLERSGVFDESLPRLQDFDLWVRVLATTGYVFVPELLARTQRLRGGISTNPDAIVRAAERIGEKYERDPRLSRRDRAMVHYTLAHKLLLDGFWRNALRHFSRAIAHQPSHARAWVSLVGAVAGSYPTRSITRIRTELTTRRWPDHPVLPD